MNSPEPRVQIPFYDAARANGETAAESVAALEAMLAEGWVILGPRLADFEAGFAPVAETPR